MLNNRHSFRNESLCTQIIVYLLQLIQQCKKDVLKPSNISRELDHKTLAKLLKLLKGKQTFNLKRVTDIRNLETYSQLLDNHPLISSHPKFLDYHYKAWWFFQLRTDTKLFHVPSTLLARYTGIASNTIDSWRRHASYPRIILILTKRIQSIAKFQQHITVMRKRCGGIYSITDLDQRLCSTHFFFSPVLKTDQKFQKYRNDVFRFLALLQLVEAGYHPSDLERHFKLRNLTRVLYYERIPYLLRVTAQIPKATPQKGLVWLPTITNRSKLPDKFIQVPRKVNHYKQLVTVLKQLSVFHKSSSLHKEKLKAFGLKPKLLKRWTKQFGELNTFKDQNLAFAYTLVGVALSDGCIPYYQNRAKFSSIYQLSLSQKYSWSRQFGERVAYYLTCLGFPMKEGKKRSSSKYIPHGSYLWYSIKSPFLTWVNQGLLGFKAGETHTNTPAKIDWILTAPSFFLKTVIQGLFDGDGWAMPTSNEIGVYSAQNQKIILLLLRKLDIKAHKQGQKKILIDSKDGIEKAVNLPIFLESKGRQTRAEILVEMNKGKRLSGSNSSLPLIRRILELYKKDLSINMIRVQIFKEHRLTISKSFISRIIKRGTKALRVDKVVVKSYFELLQRRLNSDKSNLQLVREVRRLTGYKGTMRNWLNSTNIPRDVRLFLSDNPYIDPAIIEAFPHLLKFMCQNFRNGTFF